MCVCICVCRNAYTNLLYTLISNCMCGYMCAGVHTYPLLLCAYCMCGYMCAGMHTHPLLLCAYCMCGCIGLVSQLSSFAALVKRGATLMRRGTDSVSAAPDRVCGPL